MIFQAIHSVNDVIQTLFYITLAVNKTSNFAM